MNILAIETASEACSVALSVDGETRERFALAPRGHAERVLPWVTELLAEDECRLDQLDAIAFSRGPGSFTSLRIGIGIVQGLAWGAGVPVVPLSSLRITAQASPVAGTTPTLVAVDARMGEVYYGVFMRDGDGIMQACGEEAVGPPEQVIGLVEAGMVGVGNGFARCEVLRALAPELPAVHPESWPQAAAMIPMAHHWLVAHSPLPADQAQPVYLRDQVAEKPAGD